MVKDNWERHEEFRQALDAAREALIAAHRAEESYAAIKARPHDPKAYRMDARYDSLRLYGKRAINELREAVDHLQDAANVWWDQDIRGGRDGV